MRVLVAILATIVLVGGAACSGGGEDDKTPAGSDGAATAAIPTWEPFDADPFTAIALQPADVTPGLPFEGSFSQPYEHLGVEYTASYGDATFKISSTVARHSWADEFTLVVTHLRRALLGLFKGERNYDIAGADQAFLYLNPNTTDSMSAATIVVKGVYFINIVVQTGDKSRIAEAKDQAKLDAYTKIVFDRLLKFIQDPASITPVPGTPRFTPLASTPAP